MTFSDFTTEDLMQHPDFRKWVFENDAEQVTFWAGFLQQYPEKAPAVEKAREMLLLIGSEHTPAADDEQATWARIEQSIQEAPVKHINIRRWLAYAALLAGLITGGYFIFNGQQPEKQVTEATGTGELRTIQLPDNSIVRLNVNSSLRYGSIWEKDRPREVWVTGEAYFSIAPGQDGQGFIVHTNDVDIRVLGTEFNVNTRRVKTQVVLNKGKVQLTLNGQQDQKPIVMQPGDMITYSAGTAELQNKQVDPENYSSWQQKELRFNDATLAEVVRSLQDNMDISVTLPDSAFGQQTFTGTIPLDNIEVFFKTLQRSFDCNIEQQGPKTYKIKQ